MATEPCTGELEKINPPATPNGLYLVSPNGTRYFVYVADDGTLTTKEV